MTLVMRMVASSVVVLGCWALALGATGLGESNDFRINNRDAIVIQAVNNWDGTVTVSWEPQGEYQLTRVDLLTDDIVQRDVTGNQVVERFGLSEIGRTYRYFLADLDGSEAVEPIEITPEVVVVLVRGYDALGNGVDAYYWHSETSEQIKGLVSVPYWFEGQGITCWDASSVLNGTKSIVWNMGRLASFINTKIQSDDRYNNVRFNLFGHSMGGLISRLYAYSHSDRVLKIFCGQTPHCGSPLAKIRDLWPNNAATWDLTYENTQAFNNWVVSSIPIYGTYSANSAEVLQDFSLKIAGGLLAGYGAALEKYTAENDGAVPVNSAQGVLRYYKPNSGGQGEYRVVNVNGMYNSGLDHMSCYRHPRVLNKVLQWMGFATGGATAAEPMVVTAEEDEPAERYIIQGAHGTFNDSSAVSQAFVLGSCGEAVVRAYATDPNATYSLVLNAPDGSVIDSDTTDPGVEYVAEGGVMLYTLANPQAGSWTAELTTDVADDQQYGILVMADQGLWVTLDVAEWANTGAALVIAATVADGSGVRTDMTVSLQVMYPDDSTSVLTLLDDGLGDDETAGDGVFTASFSDTTLAGKYNLTATATASDGSLEGVGYAYFTVTAADMTIASGITDSGVDSDSDGLYDTLQCDVPVDVIVSGSFLVSANLVDSDGEVILHSASEEITAEPGQVTAALEFAGETIRDHGVDGPFTLADIQIMDPNSGFIIADAVDYTTGTYATTDFNATDTDEDGLPDYLEDAIGTSSSDTDSDSDGASDYDEVFWDGDLNYSAATDANPLVPDTDSDTMIDGYEIAYGLDPLLDDTMDDFDGDGLTNLYEYENHLRPDKIDSDGDGRNDAWEIANSMNAHVMDDYTIYSADFDLNGCVDTVDLDVFVAAWLSNSSGADFNEDGNVNLLDFATIAEDWMTSCE